MTNQTRALSAAAFLSLSLMMANTGTANAATCLYVAQDSAGRGSVTGQATALKMDTACDRARRECHRRLERAFKHGQAGRGATCYRQN